MKSYRKDYPRPQLFREGWKNLNGLWEFAFDDDDVGKREKWYEKFPDCHEMIVVPFTYETKLSGIGDTGHHENVWYKRSFEVSEDDLRERRLFIHFEGSDFHTFVWINGFYVGEHKGGYSRFSFDITDQALAGSNEITVKVEDSKSISQPRGKQRWAENNFGCWYIQTTGVWKTVWLESVAEVSVSALKITPDITEGKINITYDILAKKFSEEMYVETVISYQGSQVNVSYKKIERNTVEDTISVFRPELYPWGIHMWTPEEPALYDMEIRIIEHGVTVDEVFSYFGMREIRIDRGNILLNGSPLYQRLVLDQGYWEESHLTPPNEEALIEDIDRIHSLGYNGLRKHMKIEDERFLYWCDVKGMLVWSEMAACYEFNDAAVEEFTREWVEVVKQNYNHPSIITWTPFNESWGISQIKTHKKQQHFTEGIYYLTKSIDGIRPVIVNDGWEHTVSDIITLHDYEEDGEVFYKRYAEHLEDIVSAKLYHNRSKSAMAEGYAYRGQPIIISEYGGIAFSGGKEGEWGYGDKVADEEEFIKRFEKITMAIKKIPYIAGYCYTQVSDVQQEVNGLLKADHTCKVQSDKVREINCREIVPENI